MSKIDDGGAAFPATHLVSMNGEIINVGVSGDISTRAWLAGQAMVGFLAAGNQPGYTGSVRRDAEKLGISVAQIHAQAAVAAADALLAHLSDRG